MTTLDANSTAEVERLRKIIAILGRSGNDPIFEAIFERDAALAEVERLRGAVAAVEALADEWDAYDAEGYVATGPSAYARVEEIRALLAEAVATPRWSYRGHIEPGLEQEPGLGLTPQPDAPR